MDCIRRLGALIADVTFWFGTALHHVPDVVWAALIAAGVAFFTTMLSNRNSRKQLQMQLDDGAAQRKLEREMVLKRDVYIPAAEAIIRAQGALGQLTDPNADQTAIGRQMTADLATLAKVQLVASQETVNAQMVFAKTLLPAYIEMTLMRGPLVVRKAAIALEQTFMDAAIAEHKRLIHLMKQQHISGVTDDAALGRLNAQCENELRFHKLHADKQLELNREQMADQLALGEKLIELAAKTAAPIPAVIIAAREDLGLPTDEDAIRALHEEQRGAVQETMRTFFQRARAPHSNISPGSSESNTQSPSS